MVATLALLIGPLLPSFVCRFCGDRAIVRNFRGAFEHWWQRVQAVVRDTEGTRLSEACLHSVHKHVGNKYVSRIPDSFPAPTTI